MAAETMTADEYLYAVAERISLALRDCSHPLEPIWIHAEDARELAVVFADIARRIRLDTITTQIGWK